MLYAFFLILEDVCSVECIQDLRVAVQNNNCQIFLIRYANFFLKKFIFTGGFKLS